jgi:hypothetical protein
MTHTTSYEQAQKLLAANLPCIYAGMVLTPAAWRGTQTN